MPLDRIDGEILFDIDYNSLEQALQSTGWLSGWAVTGNSSTLSVDVSAGVGVSAGSLKQTTSGTNIPLSSADPDYPRKDLIIWKTSTDALAAVTGTAQAISPPGETNPRKMKLPAPPDLTATTDILIAVVYVPAGATKGSDCTIIDKRVRVPFIIFSDEAQGDIWYWNGSRIARLPPGTAGHFLMTQGAGANPVWARTQRATSGSYVGNSSANRAIPHGLGVTPKIVLITGFTTAMTYYSLHRIHESLGRITYEWGSNYASLPVTAPDSQNFYVGNSSDYGKSANAQDYNYYWAAIG